MSNLSFKELGSLGSKLQVLSYTKVYKAKDLPLNAKKEVVFIGKSNVGKSTLINTLLNYKIAKTSKTPGCTKWIGLLELPHCNIVDLPGYGYSKASLSRRKFWDQMLLDYIALNRTSLVLILVDCRRGVSELDEAAQNLFRSPTKILFTKKDKGPLTNINAVSCKTGLGIIQLRGLIASI